VTPDEFIRKWKASTLSERSAAHSHFIDLCGLLREATPTDSDQTGDSYTFEKGATKTTGGNGWADVWKRGCFAWEYKGKHKSLTAAFAQLQQYTPVLENPPLLIVSDMESIEVHTNWTATVPVVHRLSIDDLRNADTRALLKAVFSDPGKLKPGQTRQALTEDVAQQFARLAMRLQSRGHAPQEVAHFVNRLVFCMFAEDVDLLPNGLFKRLLQHCLQRPGLFTSMAGQLFSAMRTGGFVGFEQVFWFNGGLFDSDDALPLDQEDVKQVLAAATLDWGQIDPSILGTLFERGLDPDKRGQLGAHYTDAATIMRLIEPVIVRPLTREWKAVLHAAQELLGKAQTPSARTRARRDAERLCVAFLERLRKFRVLDPACGSGNFLYLALVALKTLEHRVNLDMEAIGFTRQFPAVGPEAVLGIEINPYAAELARVSVWIGEIQWMRRHGFAVSPNPILKPLNTIVCRDALLNDDGTEAEWPDADAIIGNPPFLGAKLMYRRLGRPGTDRIRLAFAGRLSGFTDLVCYWFEKSRAHIVNGRAARAGLVATKSISKNTNLPVLSNICNECCIFDAWSNEPWVVDGAAVRVSIISFGLKTEEHAGFFLDGEPVGIINPDLTSGVDVTKARALSANAGYCFVGIQKSGPLDVAGSLARSWIKLPLNPNGRPNSDVLKPYWNGDDVAGRPRDIWLVDLPEGLSEEDVSLFEAPFEQISTAPCDPPGDMRSLKESRAEARDGHARVSWWMPYWPRPEMRGKIASLRRYLVTPMTAEHRLFYWLSYPMLPDNNLVVIAKDSDLYFGLLSSRLHEIWSTARGNRMGQGNQRRYNGTSVFETFPFPIGLNLADLASDFDGSANALAISAAAKRLNDLRENWLNPPDLVRREPGIVSGFPSCIVAVNETAARELRRRTLTNLYNKRPPWLDNAHTTLDAAVAHAYGWSEHLKDDEVLSRLLDLNRLRSNKLATAIQGPLLSCQL